MALLDASRIFRGDAKCNISDGGDFPAALSGKGNCECTDLPRRLEGGTDVLAGAGSGDAYQHVALSAERLHLALEDSFVPVVVADGGQD